MQIDSRPEILKMQVPSIRLIRTISVVTIISRMTTWTCEGMLPCSSDTIRPENFAMIAMDKVTMTVGPSRMAMVSVE